MLTTLFAALLFNQSVPEVSVTFPGLPSGTKAKAILTLPDGSTLEISEAMTVPAAVGIYRIVAAPVRASGEVLDTIFDGSSATFEVKKDGQGKLIGGALAARYSARGGTGFFWMSAEQLPVESDFTAGQLRGFRGATIGGGSFEKPDRVIAQGPRAVSSAIDGNGVIYVTDAWEGRVLRYTTSALGSAGKATLHQGDDLPYEHASVDLNGNLWLSNSQTAVMIAAADLGKSTYVPKVRIQNGNPEQGWGYPVFDGENNLYFVGSDMTILSPTDRSKSGEVMGRRLKLDEGTKGASAFDRDGNLWVPDENGFILRYSKLDLAGEGEISGFRTDAPQAVHSVQFDNKGGMLVYVRYEGTIFYRSADSLESGGGTVLGNAGAGAGYSNLVVSAPPSWSPLAKVKGWPR